MKKYRVIFKKVYDLDVEAKDEDQLTVAMQQVINTYSKFDRKAIAAKATLRFSYETVGKQLDSIYESILKGN